MSVKNVSSRRTPRRSFHLRVRSQSRPEVGPCTAVGAGACGAAGRRRGSMRCTYRMHFAVLRGRDGRQKTQTLLQCEWGCREVMYVHQSPETPHTVALNWWFRGLERVFASGASKCSFTILCYTLSLAVCLLRWAISLTPMHPPPHLLEAAFRLHCSNPYSVYKARVRHSRITDSSEGLILGRVFEVRVVDVAGF